MWRPSGGGLLPGSSTSARQASTPVRDPWVGASSAASSWRLLRALLSEANALANAAVPLAVHEAVLAWPSMALGLPASSAQWRGAPVLTRSGHAGGRARQQCNPMWMPTWLGPWLGRCPRAGLTATTGSAVESAAFLSPSALGSTRLAVRQPVITLLLERLVLPQLCLALTPCGPAKPGPYDTSLAWQGLCGGKC